ncbi:phage baseplate assembly protein V [Georgenia muralis]
MSGTWMRTEEAEREADGFLTGVAVGEVTDNTDPDGLARVRVRLPWHPDGDTSFWARLAVPMAGADRGTYFLPEVGDEVLVAAEKGDPSHLYVLGSLWNGKDKPPADNGDGANNTRVIKSRAGHTIRFNDDDAAPEIEVRLADGKRIALDKDGITVDDAKNNVITIDSGGAKVTVTAGTELVLKGATVSIDASTSMSLTSSGTLKLQGSVVQIN